MEVQQQDQKNKKNSFFENYKEGVIEKESKKLEIYRQNSGSWVFFNRIIQIIFDLLGWVIIAVFVYIWWETRGQTKIIDPNLCINLWQNYSQQIGYLLNQSTQVVNNITIQTW